MSPPRLVFMGTPDLGATMLARLTAAFPSEMVGAISQPDRPKGRELQLQPTPVKAVALKLGLPLYQPEKARSAESLEVLRRLAPDVLIVVAYGQLLPPALLAIPRLGCLNVHTSLLPRWRGAAPIQWAIASADATTGVTLMQMDAGLDTGPILATRSTDIADEDTSQTLQNRLGSLGADLLIEVLPEYLRGRLVAVPQPADGVTYARKIAKDDGRIDWTLPATRIWRRLRALRRGQDRLRPGGKPARATSSRYTPPCPSTQPAPREESW